MLQLNASEASWKSFQIELSRAKQAEFFSGKFCTFPPNSPKEDKLFISSTFKVRIFISKSASPPPPQNQMVVPLYTLIVKSQVNNGFNIILKKIIYFYFSKHLFLLHRVYICD